MKEKRRSLLLVVNTPVVRLDDKTMDQFRRLNSQNSTLYDTQTWIGQLNHESPRKKYVGTSSFIESLRWYKYPIQKIPPWTPKSTAIQRT